MNKQSADIIVIGAGMSGIMATKTAQDAGKSVICLEGRERIGGRTHTDRSLGISADLGAAWVHGPIGNPLTPYLRKLDIDYGETDFINRTRTAVQAYGKNGKLLDMEEYTAGHYAAAGAFVQQSGSLLLDPSQKTHRTIAEAVDALPRPENMSEAMGYGFQFWADLHLSYLCAADRDVVSWQMIDDSHRFPGDDYLIHGGGFRAIVEHLAQDLDIRTGIEATKISYSDDGVTVSSSAGEFTADYIIVTAPLGVLKSETITFDPPLPLDKQAAIGRIGFGHYEKVVMRFDKFYWPEDKQRLISFHDAEEGEPQLFPLWFNLGHYTGEPVILAYHAGALARLTNQWDDGYLVERATQALRNMVQDQAIPSPVAYTRSGWQKDPFSRGSYSYNHVDQQKDDRNTLREPVNGRLYFAGEATHPHFYATVHGAYETGIWAAQQII